MKCHGQIISDGIAIGKAKFLSFNNQSIKNAGAGNQILKFDNAIKFATENLEKKISESETKYDERISGIFESHKLIVNDPVLIKKTIEIINSGKTSYEAYTQAVDNVLKDFRKIENQYMLGRVVDIIDATDCVKTALLGNGEEKIEDYKEDTILILTQLKPSIIYSLSEHNVKGFISDSGSYLQHSGIIARATNIPGIVCQEVSRRIKENDIIILDSINGYIHINPNEEILMKYSKGATE